MKNNLGNDIAEIGGLVEWSTNILTKVVKHPQNLDLRLKNWFFRPLVTYRPVSPSIMNGFLISQRFWKEERKIFPTVYWFYKKSLNK